MDNQRVNRRPRNFPAELGVEIVDCLPLENAVQFLANVPNRLIIHHCAPRVRHMLKMIYRISADYARALPAPERGIIWLKNRHQYTPEMDIFLRYGAAHFNHSIVICRGIDGGFVGYPANFFDALIKYYYETKVPEKAFHYVGIALNKPAPWPAALFQPQAREMKLKESKANIRWKRVHYFLRNKHNPGIAFGLYIHFGGDAKCYQQMTSFIMRRVGNVQSGN